MRTVQLGCQWVVDVNHNHLPVGLTLVDERHGAEHFDLLHLAGIAHQLANLADVQRVVVALGLGVGVQVVGVFPRLNPQNKSIHMHGNVLFADILHVGTWLVQKDRWTERESVTLVPIVPTHVGALLIDFTCGKAPYY